MAEIDKGLVLRLEATTMLLTQQLRQASTEVEGYADRSNRALTVSAGQQQNAIKNLGFQFNDFLVQVQGGTPILRAFAQQSGQAAGALADMGGKAGVVGRFFSGILGGGILAAGTALASYLLTLGDTNDALDLATIGATGLADAQSTLGEVFDLTTGKIKSQNELLIANARLTAVNLRAEAQNQRSTAATAIAGVGTNSFFGNFLNTQFGDEIGAGQRQLVQMLDEKRIDLGEAIRRSAKLDYRYLSTDRAGFQQALIDRASAGEKDKIADLIDSSLDSGRLAPGLVKPSKSRTRKTSDADLLAQSMGFADNAAYQRAIEEARQGIEDRERAINPFPGIQKGVETFDRGLNDIKKSFDDLEVTGADSAEAVIDQFIDLRERGVDVVADGIADLIGGTQSFGDAFRQMINRAIADLVSSNIRSLISNVFDFKGGGGGIFATIGGLFGGARESGGPVDPSRIFLVGEKGPELFVPPSMGAIVPNSDVGRFASAGSGFSLGGIHVDARGATDPAAVERAAHRAVWAAAPLLVQAAQGRTLGTLSRPTMPAAGA